MADGIKIRELTLTSTVSDDDVLVIDKLSNVTSENVTFQLTFLDFKRRYIGDAFVVDPEDDDILVWEDGKWVNKTAPGFEGNPGLSEGVIIFPTTESRKTFVVTVADRTSANRWSDDASTNKAFYLDAEEAPAMIVGPGRTFRFDTSDPSNVGYDFRFFTIPTNDGLFVPYEYGVTVAGTPGSDGSYTEIIFTQTYEESFGTMNLIEESPRVLFYNCLKNNGHDFMGNSVFNAGRIQDVEFGIEGGGEGSGDIIGPFQVMNRITELETKVQELTTHLENLITIE